MQTVYQKIRPTIKSVPSAYWALLYSIFYGTPWKVKSLDTLEGASSGLNGIALDQETGKFKVFKVMHNGKVKIYK